MHTEIERKFLVDAGRWRPPAAGIHVVQGYISTEPGRVVRVRIQRRPGQAAEAILAIKGEREGPVCPEWEFSIGVGEARELLDRVCLKPPIEKIRYEVEVGGWRWEVDEFLGANAGLVLAEIELPAADASFELPPFVGAEVTDDPRYTNAYLAAHPFGSWPEQEPGSPAGGRRRP
ncbi:MAG: adenylate cyclase [Candidatus Dadabacteria bacterium]|nr:MAG: adenylate cyclase [Candidatus Dadabacteria bacterium]